MLMGRAALPIAPPQLPSQRLRHFRYIDEYLKWPAVRCAIITEIRLMICYASRDGYSRWFDLGTTRFNKISHHFYFIYHAMPLVSRLLPALDDTYGPLDRRDEPLGFSSGHWWWYRGRRCQDILSIFVFHSRGFWRCSHGYAARPQPPRQ